MQKSAYFYNTPKQNCAFRTESPPQQMPHRKIHESLTLNPTASKIYYNPLFYRYTLHLENKLTCIMQSIYYGFFDAS